MPYKVMPHRAASAVQEQSVEEIAAALEGFLAENPRAVVLEDGRVLFDMRFAKYTLKTEHGRCTLHLWAEDGNLVRRVSSAGVRNGTLRLGTQRLGQSKPQTLEMTPDKDRRTPSTREATRVKYLRLLERVLGREFPEWRPEGFRTAMDLEKSFGPAYARGLQVQGNKAWAVIAVNGEESQGTVDGILTLGILWLQHCRETSEGRRLVQGLRVIVPCRKAALTISRLAWMNTAVAQWELWELNEGAEAMERREAGDHGNLTTRLMHLPDGSAARERFAEATMRVMEVVPEAMREEVEQRVRSGSELAFLWHGLEFARARLGFAGNSFQRAQEITFGAGAQETALTEENAGEMGRLVARLCERRSAEGDRRDPLYRMQPELWLESTLRRDITAIDEDLDRSHVYAQVQAFAASDRGRMDLLSVRGDGRLAVIELKAEEDLQLALQGLDYWVRVRWHHLQTGDSAAGPSFGLGEFQRNGYFGGVRLSAEAPRLYLVAPALRVHPATETVLRYLSPAVEWVLVALDERWRQQVKVVWRRRSQGRQGAERESLSLCQQDTTVQRFVG